MTFNRAKNGGLGALVVLLILLASLGHWESLLFRQKNKAVTLGNNLAYQQMMQQLELLDATEVAFEIYRRSESIPPDTVTQLLDQPELLQSRVLADQVSSMPDLLEIEVEEFLSQEIVVLKDVITPTELLLESLKASASEQYEDSLLQQAFDDKQDPLHLVTLFRNLLFVVEGSHRDWTNDYYAEQLERAAGLLTAAELAVRKMDQQRIANIARSAASIEKSLERTGQFRGLLSAAGVLLAIAIAIGLGRLLGTRVRSVAEGTKELSGGHLDHRIPVHQNDQLGQLASAFNQMAEQLQKKEMEQALNMSALDRSVVEAEAANVAKSEFLASMSHEIRTPINGVLGTAELLSREQLTRSQRHLVQTIQLSGRALLGVINDILDFSKIEAGHMEVELAPFNLFELVEDVCEMAAPSAHGKGLEINCVVPVDVQTTVLGDAVRIRQVLTNLVSNAIKFTDSGDVVVAVRRKLCKTGADTVLFEVRDTGIGIADDVHETIFSAFSQADRSTTRRYGGTGLGLSISLELVKLMGGEITLDSEPGEGARFRFALPLEFPSNVSVSTRQSMQKTGALLACGNFETRTALTYQLEAMGVRCTSISNGHDALASLKSNADRQSSIFDVVFIDDQLADMSGIELAHSIESDFQISVCPKLVALCLVNEEKALIDQRKAIGMGLQLIKPVRHSALYNCLLEVHGHAPNTQSTVSSECISSYYRGTVLLAEDHPVNQDIVSRMLKSLGCEVVLAENGLTALSILKTTKFDLVLMDCDMPVMDGLEATRCLRERESTNPTSSRQPIVALTANALGGDRDRCLAAGMDEYLSKPVNLKQMNDTLSQWLSVIPTTVEVVDEIDETAAVDHALTTPESKQLAAVLDMATISGLLAMDEPGDVVFLNELIAKFLENWPRDHAVLCTAVESAEADPIRKAAHRLKSASASLGAVELAALCSEVETAARDGRVDNAAARLLSLEEAHQRALSALQNVTRQAA